MKTFCLFYRYFALHKASNSVTIMWIWMIVEGAEYFLPDYTMSMYSSGKYSAPTDTLDIIPYYFFSTAACG